MHQQPGDVLRLRHVGSPAAVAGNPAVNFRKIRVLMVPEKEIRKI
jgi:hypothetical protein